MNEFDVKQKLLFEPAFTISKTNAGEFNFCNRTSDILNHFFAVLIFCYFLIKQKVKACN